MNTKNLLFITLILAAALLIGPYFGLKFNPNKQVEQKKTPPIRNKIEVNIVEDIQTKKSREKPPTQNDSLSDIEEMLK